MNIAIYGKGGIGKSTIATHLSAAFAQQGKKVLHIGCDSKFDSSLRLIKKRKPVTVNDILAKHEQGKPIPTSAFIMKGFKGIDCIEAGGPEPGLGCGGRGITKMFEFLEEIKLIEKGNYDIVLFDVLGDVVCGGFAAPLVAGLVEKVYVVVSDELLSLYVANNLCKAVNRYKNMGIQFGGLILNKTISKNNKNAKAFSKKIKTPIIAEIPLDKIIIEAEKKRITTIEHKPHSAAAEMFYQLAADLLTAHPKKTTAPRPIANEKIFEYY